MTFDTGEIVTEDLYDGSADNLAENNFEENQLGENLNDVTAQLV